MGWFRSGLCPTRDRPDQVGFQIFRTAADQSENRIGSNGSCQKVVESRSGLIIWKTASIWPRKYEKQQNPARKFWKTVEIRPDLAKSNEILAIFDKILARSSEISPDLASIFPKKTQNSPDLPKKISKLAGKMMGRSDRVSRIWEEEIRSPTRWSRVLENEIRRRLPEQSVRSAMGRVRSVVASGSVPAGPWTTLIYTHRVITLQKVRMES